MLVFAYCFTSICIQRCEFRHCWMSYTDHFYSVCFSFSFKKIKLVYEGYKFKIEKITSYCSMYFSILTTSRKQFLYYVIHLEEALIFTLNVSLFIRFITGNIDQMNNARKKIHNTTVVQVHMKLKKYKQLTRSLFLSFPE